ncbi:Uncharacterised protein [Klebsiella pneumoniae]|nr:hypothetical protein [Klebsiella pneumoniae]SWN76676.1 Uncharacterised protein [Klebsiella pneumoniae]SWO17425.1 Uncharacterised protein [Klebsiella pneumoniae]SWO66542.1 Uncharacterised protein [Klebsiella pneumoniae]HBT3720199.1 hypothetical protein [Klebsiella pneumoniae]
MFDRGKYAAFIRNRDGVPELATLRGKSLITEDGEAIEGEALDDVTVAGVVTHIICDVRSDSLAI